MDTQTRETTAPHLPPDCRLHSAEELERLRSGLLATRNGSRTSIFLCAGSGCRARGAVEVADALQREIASRQLEDQVQLRLTGCHGYCEGAPLLVIGPNRLVYEHVGPKDVAEILDRTVVGGEVIERLCHRVNGCTFPLEGQHPFYASQTRLLLGMNGRIDPTAIHDYIAEGGYRAVAKVLTELKPEQVVERIIASGLRGRGGGGFPTGVKWRSCRDAPSDDGVRYIICDADEGDPGAFMDCALMEGNPHAVIEGMIIGAWAIGTPGRPAGYVYIRDEYPVAREHLAIALDQAREHGLLGRDILGSGLDFDISISRGGGAFVCGESTALMASVEGDVGEPRAKHIHTVVSGLNERPTDLNNVETWANVPLIIDRGVERYASMGTGDVAGNPWGGSKGTKIFSLVGKVKNTGLVEVPMGTTLRQIVFDIGGGIKDDRPFKAVQTGGPSGGCLPSTSTGSPRRAR